MQLVAGSVVVLLAVGAHDEAGLGPILVIRLPPVPATVAQRAVVRPCPDARDVRISRAHPLLRPAGGGQLICVYI